ncbi:hypothetical protein RCL1_008518 [Eukaryota sp. TZLM3-RCL]
MSTTNKPKKKRPAHSSLFVRFLFKSLSIGSLSTFVPMSLLLSLFSLLSLGGSIATIIFNIKLVNFIVFLYQLVFFYSLLSLNFSSIYPVSSPFSVQCAKFSLLFFCFLSLSSFLLMLLHFISWLFTAPISLIFGTFDDDFLSFACLAIDKFTCSVYSDISWDFSPSYADLENGLTVIWFSLYFIPVFFIPLSPLLVPIVRSWKRFKQDFVIAENEESKRRSRFWLIFGFTPYSHPFSISVFSIVNLYFYFVINFNPNARHWVPIFYLLTLLNFIFRISIILKNWKQPGENMFTPLSFVHLFVLGFGLPLFVISDYLGVVTLYLVKKITGFCLYSSCELKLSPYSFLNNLYNFGFVLGTLIVFSFIVLLYVCLFRCIRTCHSNYRQFVIEQTVENDPEQRETPLEDEDEANVVYV